jgi:hypothetical protein
MESFLDIAFREVVVPRRKRIAYGIPTGCRLHGSGSALEETCIAYGIPTGQRLQGSGSA